jgi:hypothetical protein
VCVVFFPFIVDSEKGVSTKKHPSGSDAQALLALRNISTTVKTDLAGPNVLDALKHKMWI